MLNKFQVADLHYQRGVSLEQAGRVSEAVEEYRQALDNNPRLRAAHIAMAHYYQRHGLLTRAVASWQAVITIEPDFEALDHLSALLVELQRYEEARAVVTACMHFSAEYALLVYQLAYIDFCEQQYSRALDSLQAIEPALTDQWQLYRLMGRCAHRLGQFEAALAHFGHAMLLTNHPTHLGFLLADLRITERAQEFNRVLTIRDQLYIEHGVVCIGIDQQDDRAFHEPDQRDWSYAELAATLRRLVALARMKIWSTTCVVALERGAEPLAQVIARQLQQPLISLSALEPAMLPLCVAGVLATSALVETVQERIAQPHVMYAQSISWRISAPAAWPQIVGMPARSARLPWEQSLGALRQRGAQSAEITALIQQATAQIEQALAALPLEESQPTYRDYYTIHSRLRCQATQL